MRSNSLDDAAAAYDSFRGKGKLGKIVLLVSPGRQLMTSEKTP